MELEYLEHILFVRLKGNLSKKNNYKIHNYLVPVLKKHHIKKLVYNLKNLEKIDEFSIDAILKTKCIIKSNKGEIFLSEVPTNLINSLKRLHIKFMESEKTALKWLRWINLNYEKILKDNEMLIWKVASHFYGIDKNDLFQAGVVGLLKALKKYKNNGITKFSSFAYDYIFGEMYLVASNKNIKISKDILKLYRKIEEARYVLVQKLTRVPTNIELSEFLDIKLEDIECATKCAGAIISLDDDTLDTRSIHEVIAAPSYDIDTKILIDDSFAVLTNEEKDIIKSRYFEDLTQTEVAKKLNMTQVMVCRYEKKGIEKMREYLTL